MIDYEKEIQEMDSRPLEENNDIIYIKNKAESHNLDEDLVFLARNLINYGFTGIEALSLVTKYSLAIKTKFNYSYLSIGKGMHKKDEKKEIILGLFEYLHRLTLDEDYAEEVIEKKEDKKSYRGMFGYLAKKNMKNKRRNPLKQIFNFNIDEYWLKD